MSFNITINISSTFSIFISEKHKTYHFKDEQLARDGFKKFLKNEPCPFERCRFSRQCNHIHCVRKNCFYVLHSSGQLLSHKRKHDRIDAEQTYRHFTTAKKVQQMTTAMTGSPDDSRQNVSPQPAGALGVHGLSVESPGSPTANVSYTSPLMDFKKTMSTLLPTDLSMSSLSSSSSTRRGDLDLSGGDNLTVNHPVELLQQYQRLLLQMQGNEIEKNVESGLDSASEQFFNAFFTSNCTYQKRGNNSDQIEPLNLNLNSGSPTATQQKTIKCTLPSGNAMINVRHSHCLFLGCDAVVPTTLSEMQDHLREHQMQQHPRNDADHAVLLGSQTSATVVNDSPTGDPKHLQITSIDGFFNRKRGRPPKNRVVEVYNNVSP